MPFSINNSPFIKNDALPLDPKPSKGPGVGTTLSMSGAGFGHTPSAPNTEFSATLQRDGLNNAGVLTKLFDMFDQLISAMREMFSGKAEIANQRSPAASSVLAKPDAGVPIGAPAHTKSQVKDAFSSEAQSKSKLEEGSQQKDAAVAGAQSKATLQTGQPLKDTTAVGTQVNSTLEESSPQKDAAVAGIQSKATLQTGQPIKNTPAVDTQTKSTLDESSQHKDIHIAGVQTKERLPVGVLSKVISDVANQLKEKSSEDSHQAETRAPGLRVLPQAREPGVFNVTTEANPQIKVEVNVNHCHCPETIDEAGKESRAIAVVTSRTNAPLPPEKPVLTDSVEGHVKSVITEGKDVKLVTEAKDSPVETAKTDGEDAKLVTEAKDSPVEVVKTDGKDAKLVTEAKDSPVEVAKTDGDDARLVTEAKDGHLESTKTDGKDGEHDSDHLTGPRRSGDEVAESDTSGSRETTSQVNPRTKRGVTSPGPAENESDRWNQGFSSRSRLRN
ncbi:hypothetical protein AOA59_05210 [Pseudomonas sp. 2822-15]|uniref:hypothetical protein n=1 Tax=Pseudomonas sp. 2822-15 TaxID=1712677 RepID=UPI000C15A988|nr:hypothetical protein [Pseudomonas sp. 2822-15]PIB45999.1 hypothetical protein AOA59_05210 [Pseudomonas sp. 2822-15]